LSVERRRFSAATMRSVEVGIQRSADLHLDPAGRGADDAAASAVTVEVDASLVATAAAILLVTAAARRIHDSFRQLWDVASVRGRMVASFAGGLERKANARKSQVSRRTGAKAPPTLT
jgi:hypothetical protein